MLESRMCRFKVGLVSGLGLGCKVPLDPHSYTTPSVDKANPGWNILVLSETAKPKLTKKTTMPLNQPTLKSDEGPSKPFHEFQGLGLCFAIEHPPSGNGFRIGQGGAKECSLQD